MTHRHMNRCMDLLTRWLGDLAHDSNNADTDNYLTNSSLIIPPRSVLLHGFVPALNQALA